MKQKTESGESTPRRLAASPSMVRPRRSPRWIAVGALAMVLGAVGGATVWTQSTGARPVLKVVRTVPRGEVVRSTDVSVVNLAVTAEVQTMPGDRVDAVVGKVATTDLLENTLLAPGAVGDPSVEKGTVQLGLSLAAGRLPSSGVPAGSHVQLFAVSGGQGATVQPFAVDAIVVRAPQQASDGLWIIDVAVAESQAEAVAERAAANQVVLARKADR